MDGPCILLPWVPLRTQAGTQMGVRTHLEGHTAHFSGRYPRRQRERRGGHNLVWEIQGSLLMKGAATLGLEGKLNFIREGSRVGLTEGPHVKSTEVWRGKLRKEWTVYEDQNVPCMWNGGVSKEQPGNGERASRAQALGSVGQAWGWTMASPSLGDAT